MKAPRDAYEEFAFTPFSTPPQAGDKAYLVDADGLLYVFEVEIAYIDKRTAVLNISSINSEAVGKQKPRPLEKRDYAEVELRSEGCIHVRFGTKGEIVNYSDRDGYLFLDVFLGDRPPETLGLFSSAPSSDWLWSSFHSRSGWLVLC
ncbi:MAG: hypothetical protein ACFUZC_20470 [Chthoniobacteraceae bacterium]